MTLDEHQVRLAAIAEKARLFLRVQKMRIAFGNEIGALERFGIPAAYQEPLRKAHALVEKQEARIGRTVEKMVATHPFAAYFLPRHKGLGALGLGQMWAAFGDFGRYGKPSGMFKMAGLQQDPITRRAVRRERGVRWGKGDVRSFSPIAKTTMFKLADAACKGANEYHRLYDKERAEMFARERTGPSGCPFGVVHQIFERRENSRGEQRKTTGAKTVAQCVRTETVDGVPKEISGHVHMHCNRVVRRAMLKDVWVDWQTWAKDHLTPTP